MKTLIDRIEARKERELTGYMIVKRLLEPTWRGSDVNATLLDDWFLVMPNTTKTLDPVVVDPLEHLTTKVIEGDEDAFRQLVERTRQRLYRIAASTARGSDEAQDALQECYIAMYRSLRDGSYDGKRPLAWARTVLVRTIWKQQRSLKRRLAMYMRIAPSLPAEEAHQEPDKQLGPELRAHLDALPTMQRIALTLQVLEEMSAAEIGASIGKSEGAVEQLLWRARKNLRKRLEADSE